MDLFDPQPRPNGTINTLVVAKCAYEVGIHDKEGATCPCCGRFGKVYKRNIHADSVRVLCSAYRTSGKDSFHISSLNVKHSTGGAFAKLRYWGLIEYMGGETVRGGQKSGVWSITDLGERFILDQESVKEYSIVYDTKLLGHEGDMVSIRDVFERGGFDYEESMALSPEGFYPEKIDIDTVNLVNSF